MALWTLETSMGFQLRNDFGEGIGFMSYDELFPLEEFGRLQEGTREDLGKGPRGCKVSGYAGGKYGKVLRLWQDIPTFDSADREFDSWHALYLMRGEEGTVWGVYAAGGYEVANLVRCRALTECTQELKALVEAYL